jgi:hypothetical protein
MTAKAISGTTPITGLEASLPSVATASPSPARANQTNTNDAGVTRIGTLTLSNGGWDSSLGSLNTTTPTGIQGIAATGDSTLRGSFSIGNGINNGLAFLLGASGPNATDPGLLPVVSENSGDLILNFKALNSVKRGNAVMKVQHSRDLGLADPWADHDNAVVPGTAPVSITVGGLEFVTSIRNRRATPESGKRPVLCIEFSREAAESSWFSKKSEYVICKAGYTRSPREAVRIDSRVSP